MQYKLPLQHWCMASWDLSSAAMRPGWQDFGDVHKAWQMSLAKSRWDQSDNQRLYFMRPRNLWLEISLSISKHSSCDFCIDVSRFVGSRTCLDTAVSFSSSSCGSRKHHIMEIGTTLCQELCQTLTPADDWQLECHWGSTLRSRVFRNLHNIPLQCKIFSFVQRVREAERGWELVTWTTSSAPASRHCRSHLQVWLSNIIDNRPKLTTPTCRDPVCFRWTTVSAVSLNYHPVHRHNLLKDSRFCREMSYSYDAIFVFIIISFGNCSCNFYRDSAGKRDQFHLMA